MKKFKIIVAITNFVINIEIKLFNDSIVKTELKQRFVC